MKKVVLFLASAVIFLSGNCNSKQKPPSVSFYYWKTIFSLSEIETKVLIENDVNCLYIRYFDIDLDQEQKPYPVSPVIFKQNIDRLQVIPVVYIKNKVFLNKKTDLKALAEKVSDFVNQINIRAKIENDEIQIDCDWTLESRDNYMKFIEYIRTISRKKLSATIRLHQVKYYMKTKIPNVDYGVLMYYNMGKIAADTLNSIYDKHIANRYLSSLKAYPLKLVIALPLFSWGLHIRDNKVIDLIGKLNLDSFKNDSNFIAQANQHFLVKNSTIKFGYYFKENDKIKIENINFNDLKEMSSDLEKNLRKTPEKIIFYDLDSTNLIEYKNENQSLKKIINHF